MIPVLDSHLPHLFASGDEPSRQAPPRAVLKGIGKALGMIYGPPDETLPQDLARLVQRLPGAGSTGSGRAGL